MDRLAVALGGGSARGWAHIGVLQVLSGSGLAPSIIAGTSIGAVAGGCYAAGRLEELEDFARSLTRRKVLGFLDFNLGGSGLISGKRLAEELDDHLALTKIEDLPRKFTAVATEIGTGHEIWLNSGPLVPAMRASYALPGIFRPVKLNGRWLIDGTLVNPVPVSVARALGGRLVIAVTLQGEMFGKGAVIPDQDLYDDWDAPNGNGHTIHDADSPQGRRRLGAISLLHRQFFGRGQNRPGISTVMMEAFNITQDRIARSRLAGDPPDVTVPVRLGSIGLFDFHRADEAIALGRIAAEKALDDIRRAVDVFLR